MADQAILTTLSFDDLFTEVRDSIERDISRTHEPVEVDLDSVAGIAHKILILAQTEPHSTEREMSEMLITAVLGPYPYYSSGDDPAAGWDAYCYGQEAMGMLEWSRDLAGRLAGRI